MSSATDGDGLVELSEEQRAIVAAVREFVEKEVYPVAEELEHRDEFPEAIVEQMKEMGLFGLTVPEEYGGAGLDLMTYALGRRVEYADMPAVRAIIREASASNNRMSSFILGVVNSGAFRMAKPDNHLLTADTSEPKRSNSGQR